MTYVCDRPMGCGKSSAAITYMLGHPEKLFMYVTPYLDEVDRIREACKSLGFIDPDKTKHGSKMAHLVRLVAQGKNIVTTHQEIRYCQEDVYELIKSKHYTLIIDESVDVLEKIEYNTEDVLGATELGYLERLESGTYRLTGKEYAGNAYKGLFKKIGEKEIIPIKDQWDTDGYYWQIPPELVESFDDIFVLTYLFESQNLYYAFRKYGVRYEYIGVIKDEDGIYRFGPKDSPLPEYLRHLREKIHILDNEKMNRIGDDQCALSSHWFDKPSSDIDQLRKNLINYYKHKAKVPAEQRMWTVYSKARDAVQDKGYIDQFVSFNERAKNVYRNRTALAYCVNVYMNVGQKLFYQKNGVEINDDLYALSTMVQWIWRSAIRDGKDINIYIPSRRMRELLIGWMDNLEVMS